MKTAHIFDLENTLCNIDRSIWIINKNNPTKPVLKISESDFALIESGIYRSQGFKIKFSGKTYWISKKINERLKLKVRNHDTDMSNLGISLQEYLNEDIIDHLKFDLKLENIEHLKNNTDDIFVVTSKTVKTKYKKMMRKLEEKLGKEGLKISGYFYINETFYNQRDDENAYKKSLILLRFLSGLKIVKNSFTTEEVDKYDEVHYYDSSVTSIESAKKIQETLDKVYLDTSDKQAKRLLRERIDSTDLKLKIVQVTTNEMNPFIKTDVELKGPRQIMRFESFKFKINESSDRRYGKSNVFSEGHRKKPFGNLEARHWMVDIDNIYVDDKKKIVAIVEDKFHFQGKRNPLDKNEWQRKNLLNLTNLLGCSLVLNETKTDSWYYVTPKNETVKSKSGEVKSHISKYELAKTENSLYLEIRDWQPKAIMYIKNSVDESILDSFRATKLRMFEVLIDGDSITLSEEGGDSGVICQPSDWLKVYKKFGL